MIDLHCHAMPPDLGPLQPTLVGSGWPVLVVDGEVGRVERDGALFRAVRPPLWDLDRRLAEMDEVEVAVQVISPMPVALTYDLEPASALRYSRHVNDWLAAQVELAAGRIEALGTVPLQDVDMAIDEMARAAEIGLSGLEIGTRVGGEELDSARLRPFFRAAAATSTPLFVHPVDDGCIPRACSPRIRFGLGMTTDTGLAASALVLGGVLADCPGLRVCLAHGGGAFTWAEPRLNGLPWPDGAVAAPSPGQLWVDCLVFDAHLLPVLKHRYGVDRLVLGSDHPFLPGRTSPSVELDAASELGLCSADEVEAVRSANALEFLRGPSGR